MHAVAPACEYVSTRHVPHPDDPFWPENCPAAQVSHPVDRLALEYSPAWHSMHLPALSYEKRPGPHAEQLVASYPSANVPARQFWHNHAPVCAENEPGRHDTQSHTCAPAPKQADVSVRV